MKNGIAEEVRFFLECPDSDAGICRCLNSIYHKSDPGQFQMYFSGSVYCLRREISCPLQEEEGKKVICNYYKLLGSMKARFSFLPENL